MRFRVLLTCALLITAALLAAILGGCADRQPMAEPTDEIGNGVVPSGAVTSSAIARSATGTATLAASETATRAATSTMPAPIAAAYTPDGSELASYDYDGWQTYENADYGFVLRLPADWSLTEVTGATDTMAGHRVDLVDDADPRNRLHLAYRQADQAVQITPTGMGQGEVVERGSITFLGETLYRRALVDRDADTRILYGTGEILRGDLVFWMGLYRLAEGDDDRNLPVETQRVADAILSSLALSVP